MPVAQYTCWALLWPPSVSAATFTLVCSHFAPTQEARGDVGFGQLLPALYLCSVRSENERLHYDLKGTSQIYHEVLKYLYATLRRHCELTRQPTRQSRWNGHVSQQLT